MLCTWAILASPPSHEFLCSHLHALERVKLRPHVQVKVQLLRSPPRVHVVALLALVEVDDVLDLLAAAAFDDPVVSVEGFLGAHDGGVPFCFGAQGAGAQTLEGEEFGAAAGLGRVAFPLLDEVPGALVDGVVDGDDAADALGEVLRTRARGVFAHDGVEELSLRGVDPVPAGVAAGLDFVVCGRRAVGQAQGGGAGDG